MDSLQHALEVAGVELIEENGGAKGSAYGNGNKEWTTRLASNSPTATSLVSVSKRAELIALRVLMAIMTVPAQPLLRCQFHRP